MADTGEPAFPNQADWQFRGTPDERQIEPSTEGMTLLDWFAGTANEGDIQGVVLGVGKKCKTRQEARYEHAKAMLAEKRRIEGED